jgi:ribosomal-protein-alanine N-acetyltransferase
MNNLSQVHFPILQSERLILRKLNLTDADEVFFLRSDLKVGRFIVRKPQVNIKQAIDFINNSHDKFISNSAISWAIILKDDEKLIGTISLHSFTEKNSVAEVGYDLNPKYQKKGFMSEALKLVVSYGFINLELSKIEAFTQIENISSKLLLKHNKFELHPTRTDPGFPKNVIFELFKENYYKL